MNNVNNIIIIHFQTLNKLEKIPTDLLFAFLKM